MAEIVGPGVRCLYQRQHGDSAVGHAARSHQPEQLARECGDDRKPAPERLFPRNIPEQRRRLLQRRVLRKLDGGHAAIKECRVTDQ